MFKLITFFCLFFITVNAFADDEENFLCSAFYVKEIVARVDALGTKDKYKHCSVSCMLECEKIYP